MATYVGTDQDDTVTGTLFDDLIQGGDGNDTLNGGSGTDRLEGGLGDDTYYQVDYYGDEFIENAGEGTDTLIWTQGDCWNFPDHVEILRLANPFSETGSGNALDNTIFANDADNWLYGHDGNDTIIAGAGNDIIEGNEGLDTMYGGAGDDIYRVTEVGDIAIEFAGEGTDTVQIFDSAGGFETPYVMADHVENLIFYLDGSDFYHRAVTGNDLDNTIDDWTHDTTILGMGGNDVIYGGGYDDRVEGGDGDDYLDGSWDNDTLNGGAGNDIFAIGYAGGDDTIEDFTVGEDHIGVLHGFAVESIEDTEAGALVTFVDEEGFSGPTALLLGVEADTLDIARDFITDPALPTQNPSSQSDAPDQVLTGDDNPNFIRGDWGDDTITGGAGVDDLFGNVGDDALDGGDGNDNLDGEAGTDTMTGGLGNDQYAVRELTDVVVEAAGEGIDTANVYVEGYTLAENVERLDLRYGSALTGTGNADANYIVGNALANTIDGGAGADDLYGGYGTDLILGGDGDDRLDSGEDGPGTFETGYENIGDIMTGGAGADRFVAGWRFENDFEPNGHDTVTDFSDGEDLIEVWGAYDWRSIETIDNDDGTQDTLVVFDDMQYFDATLLLKGVTADQITAEDFIFGFNGTSFADTIEGSTHNDEMNAGEGADVLKGNGGRDRMIGGTGDDTYFADKNDTVTEGAGAGVDTVVTSGDYALGKNVENLKMTDPSAARAMAQSMDAEWAGRAVQTAGIGNDLANTIVGNSAANLLRGEGGKDVLRGNEGADTLIGGAGKDQLRGDLGADTLKGGEGKDVLSGGRGADHFVFTRLADGGDRITDFNAGEGDVIDLSGIDGNIATASDQAFAFVNTFSGHAGEAVLIYREGSDRTSLQLDADGDAHADFVIQVNGQLAADVGWIL
jgi:Ca2+-binding RTX toxin-like protein